MKFRHSDSVLTTGLERQQQHWQTQRIANSQHVVQRPCGHACQQSQQGTAPEIPDADIQDLKKLQKQYTLTPRTALNPCSNPDRTPVSNPDSNPSSEVLHRICRKPYSQRLRYPLTKEYTLNYSRIPSMI